MSSIMSIKYVIHFNRTHITKQYSLQNPSPSFSALFAFFPTSILMAWIMKGKDTSKIAKRKAPTSTMPTTVQKKLLQPGRRQRRQGRSTSKAVVSSSDKEKGGDQEEKGDQSGDEGMGDYEEGDTDVEVCVINDSEKEGSGDIETSSGRESSEQEDEMSKEKIKENGEGDEDVDMGGNDVGDMSMGGNDVGDVVVGRNDVWDVTMGGNEIGDVTVGVNDVGDVFVGGNDVGDGTYQGLIASPDVVYEYGDVNMADLEDVTLEGKDVGDAVVVAPSGIVSSLSPSPPPMVVKFKQMLEHHFQVFQVVMETRFDGLEKVVREQTCLQELIKEIDAKVMNLTNTLNKTTKDASYCLTLVHNDMETMRLHTHELVKRIEFEGFGVELLTSLQLVAWEVWVSAALEGKTQGMEV
ncbi:hypothetical protein Sjap_020216 [Stephania japonica]|uniref:Uncharacterized protein n=1 Tax=Stephania japonica TaxID=461633 RepID=A0AAP0F5S5_9MAGN